jgi:hypothetical protein
MCPEFKCRLILDIQQHQNVCLKEERREMDASCTILVDSLLARRFLKAPRK